jgi:hypothetical protein
VVTLQINAGIKVAIDMRQLVGLGPHLTVFQGFQLFKRLITADLETRRGATKLTPFRWRLPIDAVAQRALRHFIALGKPKSPIASMVLIRA